MAYTFEDLKKKRVAELREIASEIEHDAVKGYTQLNKDHLLTALCEALGIESHEHHEVVGVDKKKIKDQIKAIKKKRDEDLEKRETANLKQYRRQIKRLKRTLKRSTV